MSNTHHPHQVVGLNDEPPPQSAKTEGRKTHRRSADLSSSSVTTSGEARSTRSSRKRKSNSLSRSALFSSFPVLSKVHVRVRSSSSLRKLESGDEERDSVSFSSKICRPLVHIMSIRCSLVFTSTFLLLFSTLFVFLFTSRRSKSVVFDMMGRLQKSESKNIISEIQDQFMLAEERLEVMKMRFRTALLNLEDTDSLIAYMVQHVQGKRITLATLDGYVYGAQTIKNLTTVWTTTNSTVFQIQANTENTGPRVPWVIESTTPLLEFAEHWWVKSVNFTDSKYMDWNPMYRFNRLACSTGLYARNGTLIGALAMDIFPETFSRVVNNFPYSEKSKTVLINTEDRTIVASTYAAHLYRTDCTLVADTCVDRLPYLSEALDIDTRAFLAAIKIQFGSWKQMRAGEYKVNLPDCGTFYLSIHYVKRGPNVNWVMLRMDTGDRLIKASTSTYDTIQLLVGAIIACGTIVTFSVAMSVTRGLDKVALEMKKLASRSLLKTTEDDAASRDLTTIERRSVHREIRHLQNSFGIIRRTVTSFTKFVPLQIVEKIVRGQHLATELYVERRFVSIFFSAIVSFTEIAETIDPAFLLQLLSDYLGVCTPIINAHEGFIGDFIGDSIMAFHGATDDSPDHPIRACESALLQQEALRRLNRQWDGLGIPTLRARMGIHTGHALAGNIGSTHRLKYGIVGDAVNLTSRLENLNKRYEDTSIILSESTCERLGDRFETRALERVFVKGRTEATELFELLGKKGAVPVHVVNQANRFSELYFRAWKLPVPNCADGVVEWTSEASTVLKDATDYVREYPTDRAGQFLCENLKKGYMTPTHLCEK